MEAKYKRLCELIRSTLYTFKIKFVHCAEKQVGLHNKDITLADSLVS